MTETKERAARTPPLRVKSKIASRDGCVVTVEVEVPAGTVQEHGERVFARLQATSRLPGFRPGKAPLSLVKSSLMDHAQKALLDSLVPEALSAALEAERLRPAVAPELVDAKFEWDQPLRFTARVEIRPEVNLKSYKGLKIERRVRPATDESVRQALEDLRERLARLSDLPDGRVVVEPGDYVVVDSVELRDGKPVPRLGGQAPGRARNALIHLAPKDLPASLVEGIVGMAVGSTKEIVLVEDAPTLVRVTVKAIKEKRVPPLDESLAKEVGVASLAELIVKVRQELEARSAEEADRGQREHLITELINRHDFPVPPTLIQERARELLAGTGRALANRGMAFTARTEEEADTIRTRFRQSAERQVRTAYLLDAIARKEGLDREEGAGLEERVLVFLTEHAKISLIVEPSAEQKGAS